MTSYRGSCLCGAVRFQVDEGQYSLVHCHCSLCRKHHGAAFGSYLNVPRTALVYLAGEHLLTGYASSAEEVRRFCSACGSSQGSVDVSYTAAPEPVYAWGKARAARFGHSK